MKESELRKSEMIASARKLLEENGLEGIKVSTIVKSVGVAQGLFYYYFKSKDEIISIVMDQLMEEMEAKAVSILDSKDLNFYEKLVRYIDLEINHFNYFGIDGKKNSSIKNNKAYIKMIDKAGQLCLNYGCSVLSLGVKNGMVKIRYPNETLIILIAGMKTLAYERPISREIFFSIVEQGFNLEQGSLHQLSSDYILTYN